MASLRREVGLPTVVATSTGLPFAALEYLAAASLVGYVAGDSAWIAIGVAAVLSLLSAAFFGELNGLFPTAAGIRLYMSRALSDRPSLTIAFTYLTTVTLVIGADAYIVEQAMTHVLHGADWAGPVWIVVVLALATVANLRGIRIAGRLQMLATGVVLAGTLAISLVALGKDGFALHGALNPFGGGHSVADFGQAVALGVFLFAAFEWVTTNAEEVRDPARTISRGMVISIGVLFVVCSVVAIGISHLLSRAQLDRAYPQLYLGEAAGGAGLALMMGITAVTAVNTFNGGFATASRFMYAAAREGSLPPAFAQLNRWAVPQLPVIALAAASLTIALAIALTAQWKVVVATGAALETMIYAVAGICVYRLRSTLPDADRPFRLPGGRPLALGGVVLFGLLAIAASVTVDNATNPAPLLIILGLAGVSWAYVTLAVPRLRAAEAARRRAAADRRKQSARSRSSATESPLPPTTTET